MADRRYANTDCPYCRAPLDPLPRAKKRCPACGEAIYVRSGPDGLTYLLQESDLPALEAAWQEDRERRDADWLATTRSAAAALTQRALADYARLGAKVEFFPADDACEVCAGLRGRVFDPQTAPPIPVTGCQNDLCRCDYLPVL